MELSLGSSEARQVAEEGEMLWSAVSERVRHRYPQKRVEGLIELRPLLPGSSPTFHRILRPSSPRNPLYPAGWPAREGGPPSRAWLLVVLKREEGQLEERGHEVALVALGRLSLARTLSARLGQAV